MSTAPQTELLALSGPAHLCLLTVEPGAPTFEVVDPDQPEDAPLRQSFVYRRERIVVGVHRPMDFLVPADLSVKHPDAMVAWVFNQMCQALMGAHPFRDRVLLALGFNVRDHRGGGEQPPHRVIRANVTAFRVMVNGQVGTKPVRQHDANLRIDAMELEVTREPKLMQRERSKLLMFRALEPFIERAVEQIVNHRAW